MAKHSFESAVINVAIALTTPPDNLEMIGFAANQDFGLDTSIKGAASFLKVLSLSNAESTVGIMYSSNEVSKHE
ncbi:hypothetical protein [Enterovibrio coralii]|uniref:Uncharacterized protein n=1 Tax=Enterovibrio coralii TaxID=294935 RepID=A0A135I9X1_9GAMM|nr:hypothetical protein [Enterovibrio coralii]KXF82237.1 hypothetical protein ATN88_24060 [Enterovibrio coralii]